MTSHFQNAAVAYSRTNGTILWHTFKDVLPIPNTVNASQILEAYDHLLLDTTELLHQSNTSLPLFSGSAFPTFLWLSTPEFSDQHAINPATSNAAFSSLQCLLAIPLYLGQNGAVRRLIPASLDGKSVSNSDLAILFAALSPLPARTSPIAFAYHRYEVAVSRSTLIAYILLSGIALLACVIAQLIIIASTKRNGQSSRMPDLSRYPALDLFVHCTIEDENRGVIYQGRSGVLPSDMSQRSLLTWLSKLSVKWSMPSSSQEELQFFEYGDVEGGPSSQSIASVHPYPSRKYDHSPTGFI
jgi:hypothetical protein